jgi:hypothetical protein
VVFGIPLSSLYCNTLLANLNARAYIRGETTTHNPDTDLVIMGLPGSGEIKAEDQSKETETKPISSTRLVSVHDPSWLNPCVPMPIVVVEDWKNHGGGDI